VYEDRCHLTDRFDRALVYATHIHGAQVRKGTSVPYVAHLLAVAATVLEYGGNEDMAIAGLLHDAAEDQGGARRLDDIRHRFGENVAEIVADLSDSLAGKDGEKEEWRARKERYLAHLATLDRDTLLVSLADKTHNARSILRDLRKSEVGRAIWKRFSRSREDTLWYYRALAAVFAEKLPGQLAEELAEIVDVLGKESA
jgi:(p)ppGpp synthase/HD superfamily hydrolase